MKFAIVEYKIGTADNYEIYYHIHRNSWIYRFLGPTFITQMFPEYGKFESVESAERYLRRKLEKSVWTKEIANIEIPN